MVSPGNERLSRLQVMEALERDHDLFSFRVDGWSAWRVMRNSVHWSVNGLPLTSRPAPAYMRALEALGATLKAVWLLLTVRKREIMVRTCRSALRFRDGDQFRDVYFDGLLKRGHSCLKLEEINSLEFERQAAAAWRPADLNPIVFTFWGRVFGMLFPVKSAEPFCRKVADLFKQSMQLDLDVRFLLMRISTVYWQARLYGLMLDRVRPKAVFVADTGEYALCLASHRRGVRFIELQHGVFDATHPDAVPDWVNGPASEILLPHSLACRGEYWIEQLAGTRQGNGIAIAVGNELIDYARKRKQQRAPTSQLHLVVSSQGLDRPRLVSWLAGVVRSAPPGREWRLSVKLHPIYDVGTRDFDELARDARVRIIGAGEDPNVFELIADADVHLSIASACHFDAAAIGVPTIVVPLSGHEPMLGAVNGVSVFLAHAPEDVWQILAQAHVESSRTHRYSAPGFVDNLQRLIA